ncbi:MAG TPA: VanZ family protein [Terriglobia bacterium]|nr:VanZ family protein [Terriglobia bacterium]
MKTRIHPTAVPAEEERPGGRNFLYFAALAYTLFVVYGSLVPLTFQPHSLSEAWERFRSIPYLQLGIASRADWVSNILLFIPLAFFWQELLGSGRGRLSRALLSFGVFGGCCALSVAIEFTQIFFPPRTVSINDIVAEGIGGAVGIACAWLLGSRSRRWLEKLGEARGTTALAERALWIYLGLVLFYNVMPLDLTISPAEIYHKWEEGRVVLNPFNSLADDPAQGIFGAATDALVWAPVALLWILAGRGGRLSALLLTGGAAAAVEVLQLFVYTRVTELGDIGTAAVGGVLGAAIGSRLRRSSEGTAAPAAQWALAGATAAVMWLCVLGALFWYPFNFQMDGAFAVERLGRLQAVPFLSYYWNSEYQALSGLLRKMLLFLPLGLALGVVFHPFRETHVRRLAMGATTLIALVAASAVELGEAFLPGKYPDSTDLFLEFAGVIAGYALYAAASARIQAVPMERNAVPSGHTPRPPQIPKPQPVRVKMTVQRTSPVVRVATAVVFFGTLLWMLTKLPFVPYNFRNLSHPAYPYISMVLVAAALTWSVGVPAWISRRLATDSRALKIYPVWILLYGFVAWVLVFFAVEPVRPYKIVGAPILDWPWHFEFLLRFLALMGGIGGFAVLGCIIGGERRYLRRRLAVWLLHAIWFLPLVYWAVIVKAATDNIVELLAWNANPVAALLVSLVIVTVFAAAMRLRFVSSGTSARQRALALAVVLLSFLVGYGLLWLGTEPALEKYGKVFSGMQFILSADREHYAQGGALFVRYLIAHLLLLMVAATGRWLFLETPERNTRRGEQLGDQLVIPNIG